MTKRMNILLLRCLVLCLMLIALCVPVSAAGRTLKLVSKVKYGSSLFYVKNKALIKDTNGKVTTVLDRISNTNRFYTDGSEIFYPNSAKLGLYSLSLKTGKVTLLCDLNKYRAGGSWVMIVRAVGNAFFVRVGKANCLVNIATKKVTVVSLDVAIPASEFYNGYVYTIVGRNKDGNFALGDDVYQNLMRYRLRDGARTMASGRFTDVRKINGELFVTKYDIKADKYRVYKTDISMKNMTPVTGRLSAVPSKYQSTRYYAYMDW